MNKKKNGSVKKMFTANAFKAGGYSTLASVIVIVIAIVVNLIVVNISTAYTSVDTTSSGLFSVSDQTKKVISALENDVTVYYVVSSGSENDYTVKLLDKFKASGPRLKVQYKDPDIDPGFVSEMTDEAVANGDLLVVSGDKKQVVHGSDLIEYEAGSYDNYLYYLEQGYSTDIYWKGEIKLLKAIDSVSSNETYDVRFIVNDDKTDLSAMINVLENENIKSQTITDGDDISIPEETDCVILTGLTTDISDTAREKIGKYLSKGGRLYVAADKTDESYDNLSGLLAEYGISFTSAVIEDGDRSFNSKDELIPMTTGEHAIIAPFAKSNYFLLKKSMGIVISEKEGVTVTPLMSTSSSAYLSTDDVNGINFRKFDLAAVADDANTGARVVVFGTSDYTSKENFEDATLSNVDLFLNSIGYLCNKDSAISVHAKTMTNEAKLDYKNHSESSLSVLGVIFAVVPAVAAVACGIVIYCRRRNA